MNNNRTFRRLCRAAVFKAFHQRTKHVLIPALAVEIGKFTAQTVIITAQAGNAHIHNPLPQPHVARIPSLKRRRRDTGLFTEGLICLGFGRGRRIPLLQIQHSDWRVHLILKKVGPHIFDLGNKLSQLQAPVSQMHVAHNVMPSKLKQVDQSMTHNSRAQMPDMHFLGEVRPTIINHKLFALTGARQCPGIFNRRSHKLAQSVVRCLKVQKPGLHKVGLK